MTDLKMPEPGTRVLIIRGAFADRYGTVADPADAGRYHDDPCSRVFVTLDGKDSTVSPLLCDIRPDALAVLEHVEQPMPTPNGHPSIQSLVRADLEAREQVGIWRYGTALQPHNGRDALRDAYEEALDLACYLRQAMVEREAKASYFVVTDPEEDGGKQMKFRAIPVPGWHIEMLDQDSGTWGRTGWSSIDEMRPYYASIQQVQP